MAATSSVLEVFQGIFNLAKENLKTEEVNKILIATDIEGWTVFNVAGYFSTLEVFQGIINLA
jgi:mannose/fructose-specific phosphotransferase system component IIA